MPSTAAEPSTATDRERLAESEALHARVREVIARGSLTDAAFDALALEVARFQAHAVAPFGRLVRARGLDLAREREVAAIPAVPTDVFRLARVAAFREEDDVRVFRTSGTTAGARGEHAFRTLATYEAAALEGGAQHLWPERAPIGRAIVLAPRSEALPDSSLSFMIDAFVAHLGVRASWHVDVERSALDAEGLDAACRSARDEGAPCLLFGTSFAFVWAIDQPGLDLGLPPGSRAMITGGFKGKTREVDEAELRAGLERTFALAPSHVVGEYGMTEMSSQLYEPRLSPDAARPDLYRVPPWVRVVAVDPATLAPVPAGEEGIARILDLANVDSAIAIQTADRVRVLPGGVELRGRLPGAVPRGCSLTIEELAAFPDRSGE